MEICLKKKIEIKGNPRGIYINLFHWCFNILKFLPKINARASKQRLQNSNKYSNWDYKFSDNLLNATSKETIHYGDLASDSIEY